ncbi:tRNA (guanosine(46)-N7)-methyltransferase TrmB [Legionella septentrionalis]|uniref:tRNA (guanosine(46)-N7)-methyltransferase TrmB n=1 Tax=Legionella septentrionalis TaxID=2498109 RepID=UPI000F8C9539|nr:tRNA (guanosine(46)-N7)-methyltransferase TrmB [Legionella septentrionalis]RUQ99922.1 tRNA (guanosine(46)-N7)-methyltransferase TrmB [Legionella septentrionalis]RUR10234.1 tRNA (guanosine(46)-N7)-methyltransferase TrmB [Legionella septentrionalis]
MQRTIKSYVLRAGRVSNRQQQALDVWLNHYQLAQQDTPWCLHHEFDRKADTIVEIGFGMGASLLAMAKAQPEYNYLGIEVHRSGIGSLAAGLYEQGINNVRIASFDAVEVFNKHIADDTLAGVQIFFPDPWPKKRHHKRRLVQPDFIHLLARKLRTGGFIHCATDWQDYAEHMLTVLAAEPLLQNIDPALGFIPRPDTRPLTKFEERGQRLGHGVWDLMFLRNADEYSEIAT